MIVGLRSWLQDPRKQAIVFAVILFLCYAILSWPVERVTGFLLDGDLVYLTGGPIGIRVLNVSDPRKPRLVGAFNTRGYAYNLAQSPHRSCKTEAQGNGQPVFFYNFLLLARKIFQPGRL